MHVFDDEGIVRVVNIHRFVDALHIEDSREIIRSIAIVRISLEARVVGKDAFLDIGLYVDEELSAGRQPSIDLVKRLAPIVVFCCVTTVS